MNLYCITDDLRVVAQAPESALIQIRAKHLEARDLAELVTGAIAIAGPRVIVNGRIDVAIACGAAGVHLPGNSIDPRLIRKIAPAEFQIGVSCHTVEELRRAESEEAEFAVYGPVFNSGEKKGIGLGAFALAAGALRMPIYALGGISWGTVQECLDAGAFGVAGISLFQRPIPR